MNENDISNTNLRFFATTSLFFVKITICLESNMYVLNLEEGCVIQSNIVPIEISFSI